MNDRFTLLTRLTWRLGFNSRGLKSICSVSSLAYVRRSRGKFNQIKRWITTNPASIWSWLSLEHRGIVMNSRYALKSLNCFTINQELLWRREYINFYKEIPREKRWPFDLLKIGWTATIICLGWATIPRSRPTFSFSSRLSDLDQSISPLCAKFVMNPRPSDVHLCNRRLPFAHVFLMAIRWTLVHMINTLRLMRSHPMPAMLPRVLQRRGLTGNIVPHGGNRWKR